MEAIIQKGGVIELPSSILIELGLEDGKKVALKVSGGEIRIKPVKNVTERLAGAIKLDDIKLIDEIVESEDWL